MADYVEGHPIPQDITGFQFRLIGDMTVKQFAYLAVGLVTGWIGFSLPFSFFIRIPIAAVFVLTGVILAFVPIQGIPADVMIMLFIKALFKPNQYVYKKSLPIPQTQDVPTTVSVPTPKPKSEQKQVPQVPVEKPITPLPRDISTIVDPVGPFESIQKPHSIMSPEFSTSQIMPQQSVPDPIPQPTIPDTPVIPEQPITPPSSPTVPVSPAEITPSSLPNQPQPMQSTISSIPVPTSNNQVLNQIQTTGAPPSTVTFQPPTSNFPPQDTNLQEKSLPAQPKKPISVPFVTDVPNLIMGVIKDSRGNVLPNILIEVKDKDDNPVRAFKTNALGQFASATPLLNGTYMITFEDPKKQHRFDIIDLTTQGEILQPLEIVSIDEREELRKSLFEQA